MAFVEPMHRNKPNITYLLAYYTDTCKHINMQNKSHLNKTTVVKHIFLTFGLHHCEKWMGTHLHAPSNRIINNSFIMKISAFASLLGFLLIGKCAILQ